MMYPSGSDIDGMFRGIVMICVAIGAAVGVVGFLAIRWLIGHVHIAF